MKFFAIGLGNEISPFLIKGIARVGGGDYEFVKDDENVEEKTQYLIKSAISPILYNFTYLKQQDNQSIPPSSEIGFLIKNQVHQQFVFSKTATIPKSIKYKNQMNKDR